MLIRFYQCIREGLNPAGMSLKTAKQPSPVIPPLSYDTGDGIFHPEALSVSSYNEPHGVGENHFQFLIFHFNQTDSISN